jgi:uncharacterized membrane protein
MSMSRDQDNPFAPPKTTVLEAPSPQQGELALEGRKVPAGRGAAWYSEGWRIFKRAPGTWVLMILTFIVMSIVLAVIPLGSLVSSLIYPTLTAGIMLGCRTLEEGGTIGVGQLFAAFRRNVGSLLLVGVLYLVGTMLIGMFVGIGAAIAVPAMMGRGVNPGDFRGMMAMMPVVVLIVVVAVLLATPLLMAMWFAPALVVFHDVPPTAAMRASFSGCLKNLVPFLLYGLVGLLLAVAAAIPAGLGMLVFLPVLWGSVYAGYRDIFLRQA